MLEPILVVGLGPVHWGLTGIFTKAGSIGSGSGDPRFEFGGYAAVQGFPNTYTFRMITFHYLMIRPAGSATQTRVGLSESLA